MITEEAAQTREYKPPIAEPKAGLLARMGRRITRKHFYIVVALAITAVLLWFLRSYVEETFVILSDQETVSAYIQNFGILGPLVLGFFHFLQVIIAFIPGHVFVVAGGYIYGLPVGFLLNITFVVTASQTGFYIAKRFGRPLVGRFVDADTLDKWQSIADKRGILFFTIAFILPVFPSDAMNFIAGLSGMDGRKFLVANILGRTPSVLLLTLVGSHGLEFSNRTWFIIAVVVALIYVVGRFTILKIERQHSQSHSGEPEA
ncbi:MAG TPA: TVP38/TMEM64 family protein [Chloroflexi bacterium]|nr:TVP38/TMEM64 family protein [Chloroflexota bacterium]